QFLFGQLAKAAIVRHLEFRRDAVRRPVPNHDPGIHTLDRTLDGVVGAVLIAGPNSGRATLVEQADQRIQVEEPVIHETNATLLVTFADEWSGIQFETIVLGS